MFGRPHGHADPDLAPDAAGAADLGLYFMHGDASQPELDFPDKRDADRVLNEPIYTYVRMRSQRVQWQQPEFQP